MASPPVPTSSTPPFRPYDDRTQSNRQVPGYANTLKRTPSQAPVPRYISAAETTGPSFARSLVAPQEADLAVLSPGRPRAMGQLITVAGRVLDEDGAPLPDVLIEVWQANCAGKYIHHNDPTPTPIDPNFLGVGRLLTDAGGQFRLRTIKPGAYAVPDDAPGMLKNWWRSPHIHFSLFGHGYTSRLVTQVFFPGEPLNEIDLILNAIPDDGARRQLIARFDPALNTPDGALGFRHDFVLRGRRRTPDLPH